MLASVWWSSLDLATIQSLSPCCCLRKHPVISSDTLNKGIGLDAYQTSIVWSFFPTFNPKHTLYSNGFEFEVRYFASKVNFLQGFCVFELCGKLVLRDMFCLMCFHIARVFSRPTCVSAERPAKCPLKNNL